MHLSFHVGKVKVTQEGKGSSSYAGSLEGWTNVPDTESLKARKRKVNIVSFKVVCIDALDSARNLFGKCKRNPWTYMEFAMATPLEIEIPNFG